MCTVPPLTWAVYKGDGRIISVRNDKLRRSTVRSVHVDELDGEAEALCKSLDLDVVSFPVYRHNFLQIREMLVVEMLGILVMEMLVMEMLGMLVVDVQGGRYPLITLTLIVLVAKAPKSH